MSTEDIDCAAAIAQLQDYLKREASPDLVPLIERHLERCAHCLVHVRFERNFLALLHARAADIRCPDALRLRITEALRRPS